jgi:hypothetical protein
MRSDDITKQRILEAPIMFDADWNSMPDGDISNQERLSHADRHFWVIAASLISSLLRHDPHARETADGALDSTWIQSEKDDLEELYRKRVGDM